MIEVNVIEPSCSDIDYVKDILRLHSLCKNISSKKNRFRLDLEPVLDAEARLADAIAYSPA